MTVKQMGGNAPQWREQMGQKEKTVPRQKNPLLADVKEECIFKWRKTKVRILQEPSDGVDDYGDVVKGVGRQTA